MKTLLIIIFVLFTIHCQAGEILDIDKGLTFARIKHQTAVQTLAVIADDGTTITALNISELSGIKADIPIIYQRLGYEIIKKMILTNSPLHVRTYPHSELLSPAGEGQHHIALGFNYADHAKEEGAEQTPFIFLKTTQATRLQKISTGKEILLDYEIEICAMPLTKISPNVSTRDIPFGYFIAGDFTDRAKLIRNINLDHMQSGRGFSLAKSKKGFFPTGPYMVVPRNKDKFLSQVVLELYRNKDLKQHASPSEMIWSVDTIVRQIFLAEQTRRPTYTDVTDRWIPGKEIPVGIAFLTGTPDGVIMQPPSLGFKIKSGIKFVFTGAFLNTTVTRYTIENYISELTLTKRFLQPGESVSMQGTFMGSATISIRDE